MRRLLGSILTSAVGGMLVVSACAPAAAPSPTAAPAKPTEVAKPAEKPTEAAKPAEKPAASPAAPAPTAAAAPAKPTGVEKVIFTTDFGFNGRHAYYYVALEKGYYKEAGFEVEIVKGNGSADAIKQVAAGKAKYGFADTATLVLSRGNENVPVKEVAIVYTKSPMAIYCTQDSGIKTPKDLEGKTGGAPGGSGVRAVFPAFAQKVGIDPAKFTWVTADSASLPPLLVSGKVDCIEQFTVGRALLQGVVQKPLTEIAYANYGLELVGNGIIATDETIKNEPDSVKRFVAATMKGLQYSIDHPDEAGQIFNKSQPQVSADIAKAETQAVGELAATPETKERGLGYADNQRIQSTIDIISAALDVKTKPTIDQIWAPGFVAKQ